MNLNSYNVDEEVNVITLVVIVKYYKAECLPPHICCGKFDNLFLYIYDLGANDNLGRVSFMSFYICSVESS
jgi:hypothetical protein